MISCTYQHSTMPTKGPPAICWMETTMKSLSCPPPVELACCPLRTLYTKHQGNVGHNVDSYLSGLFAMPVATCWRCLPGSGAPLQQRAVAITLHRHRSFTACTISCRGRGQIVAAAVASEQVILGTSKGYLLRYYWDDSGNERGAHSNSSVYRLRVPSNSAWSHDLQASCCSLCELPPHPGGAP